jgi:hypothetical protein
VLPDLDPGRFTIKTVPERVREVGDPMSGLLAGGPDMGAVMQKLAARLATKG